MSDQLPGRGESTAGIRRHRAGKEIHRANDIAQVGIARATTGAAPSRPSRATEGRSLLSGLTLRPSQQRAPSGAESEAIPGAGAGEGRIWTGTAGFQTSGVAVILDLVDAQIGLPEARTAGLLRPDEPHERREIHRETTGTAGNRHGSASTFASRSTLRSAHGLLPGRRAHRLRSVIGPTPVEVRNDHDVTMAP